MRTSCGRSDDQPTNQVPRIPRTRASATHSLSTAIYYNRLESCRSFRLLYAASRASVGTPFLQYALPVQPRCRCKGRSRSGRHLESSRHFFSRKG